jgi:hypothetical protein
VWSASEQCPGGFAECFEPLPGVRFVTGWPSLDGDETGAEIVDSNDYHTAIKGQRTRESLCWATLALLPSLCQEVDANVTTCGESFIAIHVRRTDHFLLYHALAVATQRQVSISDFHLFCDTHSERKIFLAADCAETQLCFGSRYPRRCHIGMHQIGPQIGSSLRQTTLRASAVDLFTCVEASIFKGSAFSSFSDAICHLRAMHGSTHERDEHNLEQAPSDTPYWRGVILATASAQAAHGNGMLTKMLQEAGVPTDNAHRVKEQIPQACCGFLRTIKSYTRFHASKVKVEAASPCLH